MKNVLMLAVAITITLFWMLPDLAAADRSGIVLKVRDGDTIILNRQPIRLEGVHAPELNEPGGQEAYYFIRTLVLHRQVKCSLNTARSFDEVIGTCYLRYKDIGEALVAAGLGRDCPRFSNGKYKKFELAKAMRLILPEYCKAE